MNITTKHITIILILLIILGIIIYKYNYNDNDNQYDFFTNDSLEHFTSSLNKLKKKNRKSKNNKTNTENKPTFNDLIKATEKMNPERYSYNNIKDEVYKYYKSFDKEEFKNTSKNTSESLEKFSLYKKKFFEIFK
jgi:hypothetical protein